MRKKLLLYPAIIGVFGGLTWLVIRQGNLLPLKTGAATLVTNTPAPAAHSAATGTSLGATLLHNMQQPLSLLLFQVLTIVLVARLFGWLANRIGQPSVVGEIIAGVCLGPSLFGMLWPEGKDFLFPPDSFKNLQFLSQIGLAFFMFVVGMELDIAKMKNKAHDAVMISHASIVLPFFLGVLLAYNLYTQFSVPNVSFLSFALFMGIAMSITAFPVLARIVQERKLSGTPLGILAITCAAADDVTAWCILAVVIAVVKAASIWSALATLVMALAFLGVMLYVIKPLLAKKIPQLMAAGKEKATVAVAFCLMLLSAFIAETIGIHALFGAFLAGVIIPAEVPVQKLLTDKLEDVSVLLLLPIFFAFTGLRTQIGLLGQGHLWVAFGLIMLVAVGGKLGGSALTAKLMGQPWAESLAIGALMNTRGLMELVVLNIGYDLGILSPEVFAMLVLMALTTTFMTGPLLDLVKKITANKLQVSNA